MRRPTRAFVVAAASISLGASGLLGFGALYGCDTGDAASPQNLANRDSGLGTTATDGGTVADSGKDANVQDTGIVDSGTGTEAGPMLADCVSYIDHRGDTNVNLTWAFNITSQPDHCSKISVGSTVTWVAMPLDFGTHPLVASAGGDMPNPIGSAGAIDSGTAGAPSVTITFTTKGAFPFECAVHGSMVGAIVVVDGPTDAGGD